MICFNHLGWLDPLVLLAAFPGPERLYFYGPREADMHQGFRNRLMWFVGMAVPFKPGKDDLIGSVRRAEAVFVAGARLAIAGEGAIHVHEGDLLPLQEGAAYLALRGRVPIVPVALSGTSALGFGRTVLIRIGEPIETGERPTHEALTAATWRTWHALRSMVADDRDRPPAGRFGQWLTDLFNDWGPGGRAAASEVRGPDPASVPYGPDGRPRGGSRPDG
jgi:1-acyl-sn-glycerol-3-phosphate acyltransferase